MKLQIENRTRRDVSHSRSSKHQTIRRRVMLAEITVIKSRPNDSEETKREEKKKRKKKRTSFLRVHMSFGWEESVRQR